MIYTALDNFYLTQEQLEASPSRADGIDEATERELRHYCCDVVAEAAILLRLPYVVAATAQVLVQRFYCKRSLKKFDVKVVAMAAFWLASKLEEVIEIDNPNRLTLRNVISVVDRITRRREGRNLAIMDPYSQKYEEMKMHAVVAERHMLRAFGFVVHVEHPHRFILNYCTLLLLSAELQQEAWNMANDSLRTMLCVRYRAEVVACGILFTAARKMKIPLPENPGWWELFEVKEREVYDVCRVLCDLYRLPKARHVPLFKPTAAAAAGGVQLGNKSPLSLQATPLRSPSAAVSAGGSMAAQPAPSAQPPRSEGEAPSIAQQQQQPAGSEVQKPPAGGAAAAAAAEPSTAANGAAAAPGSDGRQSRPADSDKQAADSKGGRRKSRSPSRSRSRSRSRERKRGRSRSADRERSGRREGSRERRDGGGSRHRGGSGKRSRSRERGGGGGNGGSKRDKRDDLALYRPSGGRPPRREDRRREGTHRPGALVAFHARAAAAAC